MDICFSLGHRVYFLYVDQHSIIRESIIRFYSIHILSINENLFLKLINRAATVHIPKPPPQTTAKAIQRKRDIKKKREAEVNIYHFDINNRKEFLIFVYTIFT